MVLLVVLLVLVGDLDTVYNWVEDNCADCVGTAAFNGTFNCTLRLFSNKHFIPAALSAWLVCLSVEFRPLICSVSFIQKDAGWANILYIFWPMLSSGSEQNIHIKITRLFFSFLFLETTKVTSTKSESVAENEEETNETESMLLKNKLFFLSSHRGARGKWSISVSDRSDMQMVEEGHGT